MGGGFELICQLFGEEGLAGVPGGIKRDGRRGRCAVQEEVCVVTQATQIVHGEGQVHDMVEEELPEEFLVSDGPCRPSTIELLLNCIPMSHFK